MPNRRWMVRIVDDPDSEPCAQAGDLLLAVRTPRSRDFVTVEVGSAADSRRAPRERAVVCSAAPPPWIHTEWQGEVYVGKSVSFHIGRQSYALTLAKLEEARPALPWIACEFVLEHQ
jgi:hypothetical protein